MKLARTPQLPLMNVSDFIDMLLKCYRISFEVQGFSRKVVRKIRITFRQHSADMIIVINCISNCSSDMKEKILLDSDWLRAVQFKCNISAKSVTPVQITHLNLDYDC